jgi:hypothetical protein
LAPDGGNETDGNDQAYKWWEFGGSIHFISLSGLLDLL